MACDAEIDGGLDPDGPGGPGSPGGPGTPMVETCPTCVGVSPLSRLTREEYEGTIRQVFGVELMASFDFGRLPGDGAAGPFASNARLLVDEASVGAYRDVAERAAAAVAEASGCADRECAEEYVSEKGSGLFRRSLTTEEETAFMGLFDGAPDTQTGVRLIVTALLQSPRFLYRVELGSEQVEENTVVLTGREVASRLAYFFWRQSPDATLNAAADDGRLDTAEGVRAEAARLFDDPRADRMIADFYEGWLGLGKAALGTFDEEEYPGVEALREDMLEETHAFTLALMRGTGQYRDLFTADYTYASDALAAYYEATEGTPAEGASLPRVDLDPRRRAGLLTQGAVIMAHTTEESTAGVHRGKFIRENLLCLNLPPPPPVDAVVTPDPTLSRRQRFEEKTSGPACATCHVLLNPTGFLLEHYDAAGAWRDMDEEFVIDASGALPGSDVEGALDGAVELGEALAGSEMAQRCMVRQWFRYAMARPETVDDQESLDQVFDHFSSEELNLRQLVLEMAATPAFRLRRAPVAE